MNVKCRFQSAKYERLDLEVSLYKEILIQTTEGIKRKKIIFISLHHRKKKPGLREKKDMKNCFHFHMSSN